MPVPFKKSEYKVILAYIAVCIIWGSTYLVIRIGVSVLPPELFAGIRFLTAGLMMLAFGWFKGYKMPDNKYDIGKISLIGLFLILGGNGLVVWAEQWVHSGVTALLLATSPLFIALIELFLPKGSRIGAGGWIGLLVGFGGVVLLVYSTKGTGSIDLAGAVIVLLAALSWSVGSILSKYLKASGSIVNHIGIQMLAGGLGQCIVGILLGEVSRISFSLKGLGAMAYLIFIGSFVGYSSFTYLIQKWPAAKAGTYAYVNPVVAVILGVIVLDEPAGLNVLLPMVIILCSVVAVQLSKTPKSNPANE